MRVNANTYHDDKMTQKLDHIYVVQKYQKVPKNAIFSIFGHFLGPTTQFLSNDYIMKKMYETVF